MFMCVVKAPSTALDYIPYCNVLKAVGPDLVHCSTYLFSIALFLFPMGFCNDVSFLFFIFLVRRVLLFEAGTCPTRVNLL